MNHQLSTVVQITTLEQLDSLALLKRSVTCSLGRLPACVVINMQGRLILRMIRKGMFLYKPKLKTKCNFSSTNQ